LYYDVSQHKVVELVITIPRSPRSSKWSPNAKVLEVFVSGCCAVFGATEVSPVQAVVPPERYYYSKVPVYYHLAFSTCNKVDFSKR
jgi:hypothetical protein